MNKERILAARKRLKEFQRNKKDQVDKNAKTKSDSEKQNNDQNPSIENLLDQSNVKKLESNMELTENNEANEEKLANVHASPEVASNQDYSNNSIATSENVSFQNIPPVQESTNYPSQSSPCNNGLVDHNIVKNSCSISSNVINTEKLDQSTDFQNILRNQSENLNLDSNVLSNPADLLQKQHLLHMANAMTNVLADEERFDEATLTNYDLEQKNEFLTGFLEEQKKVINQLHFQVSQCTSRISELEAIVNSKDIELETKLFREVNPLKEQVQLDAQTIGILVAEKSELIAINSQYQITIQQKTDELIDLSGKLKISEQQVFQLEQNLLMMKSNNEDLDKFNMQLQANCEELSKKLAELKKENEDFELEISELRQKCSYKNTELKNVEQELQEKCALLSLSELRIQQLSNSPQELNALESQHQVTKVLEQQLSQMKETMESVNKEKDEASKKYQNYVQQLEEGHSQLAAQLEASKKSIADSEMREQSYVERLSELEQQLQKEKAKVAKVGKVAKAGDEDFIRADNVDNTLSRSVDSLVSEQVNLQSLLNDKESEIEGLRKELCELQEFKEQNVEASRLAAALQSEQLGASRAVSQNQQLKTQLNEMNDAFIALSNTKLDLTERVQAERSISKKLNGQLNDLESQLQELKEQLARKDEELVQLEKERLQAAQIEDRVRHYQAQSQSVNTLHEELQKALAAIVNLKKENKTLRAKLDESKADKSNASGGNKAGEIDEAADNENSEEKSGPKPTEPAEPAEDDVDHTKSQASALPENNIITSVPEPVKKLEMRFKETMEKVAELTDEKQRLEHVVLQLQGETETIEEYVALYQKQRSILQDKARERENTFLQLLEQRNQQQEQLHKLKLLVANLLKSTDFKLGQAPLGDEAIKNEEHASGNGDNKDVNVEAERVNKLEGMGYETSKTTSQILDLLSEIKDCNDTCFLASNIHPCPWCSGELITI